MSIDIILSAIMLSVVILSEVVLNVLAPLNSTDII
jgi:hypothetical protein